LTEAFDIAVQKGAWEVSKISAGRGWDPSILHDAGRNLNPSVNAHARGKERREAGFLSAGGKKKRGGSKAVRSWLQKKGGGEDNRLLQKTNCPECNIISRSERKGGRDSRSFWSLGGETKNMKAPSFASPAGEKKSQSTIGKIGKGPGI